MSVYVFFLVYILELSCVYFWSYEEKKRKIIVEGEGEKIMEDIFWNDFKYLFKILVIGDVGVGKMFLIWRFIKGYFVENIFLIVGVDVDLKILNIYGDKVKF